MELEWLEKNRQRKEYYLFLYVDSPEQLSDARGGAIARLEDVNHQTGKNRSINKNDESRTNFF